MSDCVSRPDAALEEVNPFSSRFVRPGAIPFQFEDGCDAATLVDRFVAAGRRGQIVGPHGSGKSTLLAALVAELHRRGDVVRCVELRDGGVGMPRIDSLELSAQTVLVVDGFEQLGRWARFRLAGAVRRAGAGLLVTSHRDVGLPTLSATQPSAATAVALAERLLRERAEPARRAAVGADDVRRLFDRHRGNLREVFFGLYDLYESRRF